MTEEPLGVCRSTDDLRTILRARFTELGVSFETVDAVAGLPARYTQTLLGLQPKKQFGAISFDALLSTAGIMLIAVQDAEALARVRSRLTPLQRADCGVVSRRRIIIKFTPDFMRKIGRMGGLKKAAVALQKRHISEVNRRNALKRWRKPDVAADQVTATA